MSSTVTAPAEATGRARHRTILAIGLPIIGGMVSQNVMNLVDAAMVGSLGDAALAAVGTGGIATIMSVAFVMGLSSAVQAVVARRKGEGRESELAVPLHAAILAAILLSVPLTVALFFAAPTLYPLLIDDPAVVPIGTAYYQARVIGMVAIGVNFAFRGYWNGTNRTAIYMRTLILTHAVNIGLNWVLIFGNLGAPELGAVGAGVATTASLFVGAAAYFLLGLKHSRHHGFPHQRPDRQTVRTVMRLAIPSGLQIFGMTAGYTALYWIIGQVGTREVAAANVLIQIMMIGILPAMGLGLAAASLVGQALGRGAPGDARRWGWDVVRLGMVVMGLLGLPMVLAPELLLSGFLHDPATLALARPPLMLFGATLCLDALGNVLLQALIGAGAVRRTLLVSVGLQWLFFLPLAYVAGPVLGFGLIGIWVIMIVQRAIQAGLFAALWRGDMWTRIRV